MIARPPACPLFPYTTLFRSQRQLLMTALRLRPDRILLGEVRGGEALDMLQAMGTGVEGSMTTVHANSPADAFSRLERSEEHTSELQSQFHLVCRLLLEKKKN